MIYLWVGAAGMVGALLRYYLGVGIGYWWGGMFPLATLIANLSGAFVLGWFTMYIVKMKRFSPHLLTALGTGLIGSFTTFSTFSVETVGLLRDSYTGLAFTYVFSSVVGGLVMSAFGYNLGKRLHLKKLLQNRKADTS